MLISTAYAQTADGPLGGLFGSGSSVLSMAPLVLIFAVFYFLLIRPQQQQQKTLKASIAAMKRGDRVVVGGIIGQVAKVNDTTAEVEIAPGVKIEVLRDGVSSVTPSGKGVAKDSSKDGAK
jgi:preprotein translocase subunit YajC